MNNATTTDFSQVTEVAGEQVTREQIQRMLTRYLFAAQYCDGKDVLEVACGSGQGLGLLASTAHRCIAADYSDFLLQKVAQHYHTRVPLLRLDAHDLCFKDASFDTIVLYEAIYYLKDPEMFVKDCNRVLRPGGTLLMCTANRDLPDFNPSPHSYQYFSPQGFTHLLGGLDFKVECYGDCQVDDQDPLHRILSFVKKTVVRLNLMPKTMKGKKLFKRIVFGKLVDLPAELTADGWDGILPKPINPHKPDRQHKVIFAIGTKL